MPIYDLGTKFEILNKGGQMLNKLLNSIPNLFAISVVDKNKNEFNSYTNSINLARIKAIAITSIALDILMIIFSVLFKENFLQPPEVYYGSMYVLLIAVMAGFLILSTKFENYVKGQFFAASFIAFLLLWSAGISLLDQLSYNQIIVYVSAVTVAAVFPIFHPLVIISVFLLVHIPFIALLPHFQESSIVLFGHIANSTSFLVIAMVISSMRYKDCINDYYNYKLIEEKSEEINRINQKLAKLSQTDGLTGVFNRLAFDNTLRYEWERCKRYGVSLSLVMIDVDCFKLFNDTYGHQAGDDCLRQVARVLCRCIRRPYDTVARYGGEEFAIIMPNMKKERVLEYADQLRIMVEEQKIPNKNSLASKYLTISIGVHTLIPSDESSIEELINAADEALYKAKKSRNKIVVAD
jgi:diguanylate cyclase (GGDEF)-like protein